MLFCVGQNFLWHIADVKQDCGVDHNVVDTNYLDSMVASDTLR